MPSTTAVSAADDPIFAAIENHKNRGMAWLDRKLEQSEEGQQRDVERDRALDAAERAAWAMAATKPTTIAGASALLAYVTTGAITRLFELGETSWHETAFRTLVAALAEMARAV